MPHKMKRHEENLIVSKLSNDNLTVLDCFQTTLLASWRSLYYVICIKSSLQTSLQTTTSILDIVEITHNDEMAPDSC